MLGPDLPAPQVLPALVLPVHDPSGRRLAQLAQRTSALRQTVSRVFVSVSPATERSLNQPLVQLQTDSFFILNASAPASHPGDHYRAAFASAVAGTCTPRAHP